MSQTLDQFDRRLFLPRSMGTDAARIVIPIRSQPSAA